MKFLVLFASALAVASAGYAHGGHGVGHAYHGPIHLPVINGQGVPVDTHDVQALRAAHLSHVANVAHRNGDHAHGAHGLGLVGHGLGLGGHGLGLVGHGLVHPALVAHAALGHHGLHYRKRRSVYGGHGHGYHGPQHLPIINGQGVPVDTHDVQALRAAHLAHVVNVAHRNGDYAHHGHGYHHY